MDTPHGGGDQRSVRRHRKAQLMVGYRARKRHSIAALQASIAELEQLKRQLVAASPHGSMLPWHDVAEALREHREGGERSHEALKNQVLKHRALVLEMHRWVNAYYDKYIQSSLGPTKPTWRDVSLLADPVSRQLGKAWITDQMFHQMDAMFQLHGFPSLDDPRAEPLHDVAFDFSREDGGYVSTTRRQDSCDMTFEESVEFFQATLLSLQCYVPHYDPSYRHILHEVTQNTVQYAVVDHLQEYTNVLCGELRTANRYVCVLQQIQDDERCDISHGRQRNRMAWYELRRLPNGHSQQRVLVKFSQVFDASGTLSLEEDARQWGISVADCPAHSRELQFPQMWRRHILGQIKIHSPIPV